MSSRARGRITSPDPKLQEPAGERKPVHEIGDMFPIGSTVQLRSGGHLMTVVGHQTCPRIVEVVWSRDLVLECGEIPADALRRAADAQTFPPADDFPF